MNEIHTPRNVVCPICGHDRFNAAKVSILMGPDLFTANCRLCSHLILFQSPTPDDAVVVHDIATGRVQWFKGKAPGE